MQLAGLLYAVGITNDMNMKLFEDFPRTHNGFADHTESAFSFLNRSARPASARVREALNAWYERYPEGEKAEFKRRFQRDFSDRFFELLLHELLLCMGYQVEV